jgi:hypothetical protein
LYIVPYREICYNNKRKGTAAAVSAPLTKGGVYVEMTDIMYLLSFAVVLVALREVVDYITKK